MPSKAGPFRRSYLHNPRPDVRQLPSPHPTSRTGNHTPAPHSTLRLACESLIRSGAQVRGFLSIFNCDLASLSRFLARVGRHEALETPKRQCLSAINGKCVELMAELDKALAANDFDAAAVVLTSSRELLAALNVYVLEKNKSKLDQGFRVVCAHTENNKKRALEMIQDQLFDADLDALLEALRRSSEHEELLFHAQAGLRGEPTLLLRGDYKSATAALEACVLRLSDTLTSRCSVTAAGAPAFEAEGDSLAAILSLIDASEQRLRSHLTPQAQDARLACRGAFAAFKDDLFQQLRHAVDDCRWEQASAVHRCLKVVERMGTDEERRGVESRLDGVCLCLCVCARLHVQ
jgi:hypothetical protein